YGEFYGFSEDPKISEEDFVEKQRLSLIDRINRVPVPWEDTGKMDAGTAFNEVVDCIVLNKKSDRMNIWSESGAVMARYNERTFIFPVSLCREFAAYYRGAIPQVYTEAILPTQYGNVLLYGYIDILMPASVHDIKTASKYSAGKYRRNWQHIVYPYCLNQSGNSVRDFEYNIAVLTGAVGTYTEYYGYTPERDVPRLTECVEGLIDFILLHGDLITDKKIFNRHTQNDKHGDSK
ncbi:MAG: HNH endonuclease, partial [Tannerella sp.]|nr:HNH endonuclease [Tannerella sp.]